MLGDGKVGLKFLDLFFRVGIGKSLGPQFMYSQFFTFKEFCW